MKTPPWDDGKVSPSLAAEYGRLGREARAQCDALASHSPVCARAYLIGRLEGPRDDRDGRAPRAGRGWRVLIPFARLDPSLEHEPGRVEAWRESFGDERCPVPILSDEPHFAALPIGVRMVYALDVDSLMPATVRRMAALDAARTGATAEEFEAIYRAEGVSILAVGVEVVHLDTDDLAALPSGEGGASCP